MYYVIRNASNDWSSYWLLLNLRIGIAVSPGNHKTHAHIFIPGARWGLIDATGVGKGVPQKYVKEQWGRICLVKYYIIIILICICYHTHIIFTEKRIASTWYPLPILAEY